MIGGALKRQWQAGAHLGVTPELAYPTHRRVVLVNQMAMLGALITLIYGLLALISDVTTLWPMVAITPPLLAGYAIALWINAQGRRVTARLVLMLMPAIQITFATWLLSNRSGVQLYFFVLWTSLFLLYTREERWLSSAAGVLWIMLYLWLQLRFDEPALALTARSGLIDTVFLINALGTFALIGCAVALFYVEINRTEELLQREYHRSQELLENILPATIAERLKDGSTRVADSFEEVTLLFADIVGFTRLAGELPPREVVDLLNRVFSQFDRIVEQHGLEKIKTIGDEYMVAGGIPTPRADHAQAVADAALDMMAVIERMNARSEHRLALRVGIHTGEAVAGVIGARKISYDVWGDTVNTASRMQSQGLPGRIQVTEATASRLEAEFELRRRGTIRIRGKGRMPTWFLRGRRVER